MNKVPTGPSLLSSALGFLQRKPVKVKTRTVGKASARIAARGSKAKSTAPQKARTFNAASIDFDECACDAVKQLEGKRFLARDAPHIPVPDCTSPTCKCSYVRYKDRRSWYEDRRAAFSIHTDLHRIGGQQERRAKKPRRADDELNFAASDASFDLSEWGN